MEDTEEYKSLNIYFHPRSRAAYAITSWRRTPKDEGMCKYCRWPTRNTARARRLVGDHDRPGVPLSDQFEHICPGCIQFIFADEVEKRYSYQTDGQGRFLVPKKDLLYPIPDSWLESEEIEFYVDKGPEPEFETQLEEEWGDPEIDEWDQTEEYRRLVQF